MAYNLMLFALLGPPVFPRAGPGPFLECPMKCAHFREPQFVRNLYYAFGGMTQVFDRHVAPQLVLDGLERLSFILEPAAQRLIRRVSCPNSSSSSARTTCNHKALKFCALTRPCEDCRMAGEMPARRSISPASMPRA